MGSASPKGCSVQRREVLVVFGTRPEAIKLAPIIVALRDHAILRATVAVTGQHKEMLRQVTDLFEITPDYDLEILEHGASLAQITTRALAGVTDVVAQTGPDAVLVQGDTTTTFAGALAAFYQQIPVVHLEAGLRTFNRYNPFPEEINRQITTRLTSLHLAP